MTLADIVSRKTPPIAWAEGENIPWDDPAFSERMLAEHLSQKHNLASRRLHHPGEGLRGAPSKRDSVARTSAFRDDREGRKGR